MLFKINHKVWSVNKTNSRAESIKFIYSESRFNKQNKKNHNGREKFNRHASKGTEMVNGLNPNYKRFIQSLFWVRRSWKNIIKITWILYFRKTPLIHQDYSYQLKGTEENGISLIRIWSQKNKKRKRWQQLQNHSTSKRINNPDTIH